jgi:hypothetical protein
MKDLVITPANKSIFNESILSLGGKMKKLKENMSWKSSIAVID